MFLRSMAIPLAVLLLTSGCKRDPYEFPSKDCAAPGDHSTLLRQGLLLDAAFLNCDAPRAGESSGLSVSDAPRVSVTGGSLGIELDGAEAGDQVVVAIQGERGFFLANVPDDEPHLAEIFFGSDAPYRGATLLLAKTNGSTGADEPEIGPYSAVPLELYAVQGGDLQVSLQWDSEANLDLVVRDPFGAELSGNQETVGSGGQLDLSDSGCDDRVGSENAYWPAGEAPRGLFSIYVDYRSDCDTIEPTDFRVTVRVNGGLVAVYNGTVSDTSGAEPGQLIDSLFLEGPERDPIKDTPGIDLALSDDTIVRLDGSAPGDRAGTALISRPTLDSATTANVAVGAPRSNGERGMVYVLNTTVDEEGSLDEWGTLLRGASEGDQAGTALAWADDADGQGAVGLLVGAPNVEEGRGAAFLVPNLVSGVSSLGDSIQLLGPEDGSGAGTTVVSLDLGDDGVADLAIGAPESDEGRGVVYWHSGPTTDAVELGLDRWIATHEASQLGYAMAAVGNVDGDGQAGLAISAPGAGNGRVYLFFSAAVGEMSVGLADVTLLPESDVPGTGASVSGATDVNGDGYGDLLVGATLSEGRAYLVHGPIQSTVDLQGASAVLRGESSGDGAGASVTGAGDVNLDGYSDLLIGAPEAGGTGTSWLVLGPVEGSTSLSFAEIRLSGEISGDAAGAKLAISQDADGDGRPEVWIAAPDAGGSGAVYAILSQSGLL